MKSIVIALACTFVPGFLQAQNSLKEFIAQADGAFNAHQYPIAIEHYNAVIEQHPENTYSFYMLAECYRLSFRYPEAEKYYEQVRERSSTSFPLALFYLGLTQKMNNKYQQAISTFDEFIQIAKETESKSNEVFLSQAALEKEGCIFAIDQFSMTYPIYDFVDMPSPVNSKYNDFAATPSDNDSSIAITSTRSDHETISKNDLNLSRLIRFMKKPNEWVLYQNADNFIHLNQETNEGTCSYTKNFTKYYFTSCRENDCKILVAELRDGKWQPGIELNENINQSGTESKHPALNATGDTLFFVSSRPGGLGMNDIYMSASHGEDNWGPAVNMGNKINTPFNEATPFYFSNEKSLMFSSQGHAGYGGFDIFLATHPFDSAIIKNIGRPFNSEMDDLYFNSYKKTGYLASNRSGGLGNFDVYTFNMRASESIVAIIQNNTPQKEQADSISASAITDNKIIGLVTTFNMDNIDNVTISGTLMNCNTNLSVAGEEVRLTDSKGETIKITTTNTKGAFRFLNIALNQAYNVAINNTSASLLEKKEICVIDLRADGFNDAASTSKFENVYFDFNHSDLRPEGKQTLNELIALCTGNSNIQVEINGFTDQIGNDQYNYALSQKRGNTVFEYLIKHGVDRSSLVVIAKGEGNPATNNNTATGRQLNRRVEFIIKGANVSSQVETFIIEPKMTLYSLSKKYNISITGIQAANGITGNHIEAYKPIRIPIKKNQKDLKSGKTETTIKSFTYQVKKGDTVFSIARKFNLTPQQLSQLNNIKNNLIRIGELLKVK